MLALHSVAFTFVCSLSFLSAVLSLQCNSSQYSRPKENPQFCCTRCRPGERMVERSDDNCEIKCEPCMTGLYSDNYSVNLFCRFCQECKEPNLEYKSHCNRTHDAVCRCKAGYRCKDQPCKECVQIPTTTIASTLQPPSITTAKTYPDMKDMMWVYVVTVVLLCGFVAIFVIVKTYSFQRWIRNKIGYFSPEKAVPVFTCSEDNVSKPVQEMCGKCDQLLDV